MTMTGPQSHADLIEPIFNPEPGFGTLSYPPTEFDCPSGGISGYLMSLLSFEPNTPVPGTCWFTSSITFRPVNLHVNSGQAIQYDLGVRGTDARHPLPIIINVRCLRV
jgi:hypothetical protein